ncbi:hypothetical protein JHW45_14435 [Paracoccus stylophorae]|uniref:Lipopolysaccharide biosynthesis protein, LPS:glycosyltransferase n=1 Tax=Paracoccus stylophorae TaxID=659350 RepID=A0ABY7SWE3_9RHOB|nr:glycosyltransferase [Paracoccus stylophorae]WCR10252.1 hypothetical protein JHW45_14435 [Paracoccus stylophorae]
MTQNPVQIAFITDTNALQPTLVAMWSALRHATAPVRVIFVGIDLSAAGWSAVETTVGRFPDASVDPVRFHRDLLQDVRSPSAYISSATFARLFLHRFVSGRVLYLDGDILVTGDLTRIARADLDGRPAAAVCDYVVQKWASRVAQGKDRGGKGARRLERIAPITCPAPPASYVNAGLILLDMDRITAEPALVSQLEDVQAAATYPLADQDHLNRVFAGRILHLGPEWNCSWRRLTRQRQYQAATGIPTDPATAATGPVVIHYHGKYKPWQPVPLKHALRAAPLAFEYRLARSRFRRDTRLPE